MIKTKNTKKENLFWKGIYFLLRDPTFELKSYKAMSACKQVEDLWGNEFNLDARPGSSDGENPWEFAVYLWNELW